MRLVSVGLALGIVLLTSTAPSRAVDPIQYRNDFAMRFLEPESWMALAKQLHDRGERLTAFYLLETARRARFDQATFDHAFQQHFLGIVPPETSTTAESRFLSELPTRAAAAKDLAQLYALRRDWTAAEKYARKNLETDPDPLSGVALLAEVLTAAGRFEESRNLEEDWLQQHPDTKEWYTVQIARQLDTQPAEAAKLVATALERFPNDGRIVFNAAVLRQQEGKLDEAEELMLRASALAPEDANVQGWVGRFFLKARLDRPKALDHYLNAYFLDPHFYDTEFAESRIRELNWKLGEAEFRSLRARDVPLSVAALHANPRVAELALGEMAADWKSEHTEAVVRMLAHEEPTARWQAVQLLKLKADDGFDARLESLLRDPDLIQRGLAAYLAVHRWGRASFPQIEELLKSDAQLLRYDAISALALEGGDAATDLLKKHSATETHPALRATLADLTGATAPPGPTE